LSAIFVSCFGTIFLAQLLRESDPQDPEAFGISPPISFCFLCRFLKFIRSTSAFRFRTCEISSAVGNSRN